MGHGSWVLSLLLVEAGEKRPREVGSEAQALFPGTASAPAPGMAQGWGPRLLTLPSRMGSHWE